MGRTVFDPNVDRHGGPPDIAQLTRTHSDGERLDAEQRP
jgi:hypothetical protein